MASCITSKFGSDTAPQIKLTVTESSNSTAVKAILDWELEFIVGYPPSTSVAKSYTAKINGSTVASGTYDINGKNGTYTIKSGTKEITKTTSAQTIKFECSMAFNVTWSGTYGGTKSASDTISVPAKTSYTITYNANGGSGAPSSQKKWHGTALTLSSTKPTRTGYSFQGWSTSNTATTATYQAGGSYTANSKATLYAVWKANTYTITYNANGGSGAPASQTKTYGKTLTLSSTKPTRTGYSFQGWATSSTATTKTYDAGASYTANAKATLYAVWKANTYTITYDANGGSGAPSSQTKTHGKTLTLSSTKPTRTNYNFLGWSTSSSATSATYQAGGSYTENSAAKLYAVWQLAYKKPRITGFTVGRCDSGGTAKDDGTYARVKFNWACDKTVSKITIAWSSTSSTVTASGTSGSVNQVVGGGALSVENTYAITVTVTDSGGSSSKSSTLFGMKLPIDVLKGGTGVAIGKPADTANLFDVAYKAKFNKAVYGKVLGLEELPAAPTNFNNALEVGCYAITSYAIGETVTNGPPYKERFCGRLFVASADGNDIPSNDTYIYLHQTFVPMSPYQPIYTRYVNYTTTDGWVYDSWVPIARPYQNVLWSGGYYMASNQTATLTDTVTHQMNGIVLVFSYYDNEAGESKNQEFVEHFVPKYVVSTYDGKGHNFNLSGMFGNVVKYLYIYNDKIVGHENNNVSDLVVGGITYNNKRMVLRYVIGV